MQNADDKLKVMYKRQNAHISEHYDRISVTIPKGTKERITAQGESINGFVNRLIAAELESLEGSGQHQISKATAVSLPDPEPEIVKSKEPEQVPTLEELQAQLDAVRAEREQIKPELMTQREDQEQEEPKIATPAVTDPEPVSIRELAERTRQAVQEEAEKRAKAAQPTPQEQAVAELLKTRS